MRRLLPHGWGKYSRPSTLFIALLIFFLVTPSLHAQQPTAHDLAQRVDRHYNQFHSLRAQFAETYEGLGRVRSESGTLLLLKPGRMRWDYSNPPGKIFLLDGKYAWFYSKGASQVQRVGAKQLDDLRSPLRFLLGHTQLEKEIDHLALSPAANGSFTLAGIPHGQEKRIERLTLTVTADGTITGIEIKETDGAETRLPSRANRQICRSLRTHSSSRRQPECPYSTHCRPSNADSQSTQNGYRHVPESPPSSSTRP